MRYPFAAMLQAMQSLDPSRLIGELRTALAGDSYWEKHLAGFADTKHCPNSLHLAVMVEPFLEHLLAGRKTVESRFSINRIAPYERVAPGDVILLKQSGGPIVGLCQVSRCWFYQLDPDAWKSIKQKFTKALCADSSQFWRDRERAAFASLMRVSHVRAITPVSLEKRDRRGWVVLTATTS